MRTYAFDTLIKIKRNFNIQTICHKNNVWCMFNDSITEKELIIFQKDGILLIIKDGKISNGTWQYIPTNNTILINDSKQSYNVHVAFIDNTITALQIDNTKQYVFLIKEQNKLNFQTRNISDIKNYIILKEQKIIETENKKQKRLLERQERENIERLESELRKQAEFIKEKNQLIPDCNGLRGWFSIFFYYI